MKDGPRTAQAIMEKLGFIVIGIDKPWRYRTGEIVQQDIPAGVSLGPVPGPFKIIGVATLKDLRAHCRAGGFPIPPETLARTWNLYRAIAE